MNLNHDLEGVRYGRLEILRVYRHESKRQWCLCKCECGNEKTFRLDFVTGGHSKSCGCLAREVMAVANKKHGMTGTFIYRCWMSMKKRCLDKKHKFYHYYGGRGITICNRWIYNFENFLSDMGLPPSEQHSIDRIDCNGNYEPSNCRWATKREQCLNRRKPHEHL